MANRLPEKSDRETTAKITAAHLAGLRPRPPHESPSPLGTWDRSTIFITGFATAILALPELVPIFRLGSRTGAPHSTLDLLVILGLTSCFGIFPFVFLHDLCLQRGRRTPLRRALSALVVFALMACATAVMKPLLGYDEKLADDSRYARISDGARMAGEAGRSPASEAAASIREGIELFR